MLRRQIILVIIASLAAGLLLTAVIGPENTVKAIIYSPPGIVLFGRIAMAYSYIYSLTGNTHLSLAMGIFLTNGLTIGTSLAAPPALHASHTLGLRMRRRGRMAALLLKAGWELPQIVMLYVSIYLAAFTGLSIAAVSMARSPAAFMVPEALYVAIASSTVYTASRIPYDMFIPRYRSLLLKTLPAIAVLMAVSAVMEAYEIL
jgi:hypothetical protein